MTRDPEVAHLDAPVDQLARTMQSHGISGLPVVDGKHQLVGVVTRTDLITIGLDHANRRHTKRVMSLPHQRVSEIMTHQPAELTSSATLRQAGRMMIDHQIHRVFVTEGGRLSGVICAVDLTAAVRDANLTDPVSSVMSSPILSVDVKRPLGEAMALLDRAHVTGLIVTEDDQPIGMFTQIDALASRELPSTTPLEEVYDAAIMCVPGVMKLHRVAAHVCDLRVRRVVVCQNRDPIGIVSATDFARVVATA